jgi:glyceraldehyde 3-phosphate dehydrogenase
MNSDKMISVGINGFGRIGKCVFLQLLNTENVRICAINAHNLVVEDVENYLKYDSTHHYCKKFKVEIFSKNVFKINHHTIHLFGNYDAKTLQWKTAGCSYLIDATGAFLTTQKCVDHDIDYVVMTAPPKDSTPTFIYGVNDNKYRGEKIVSASSCTTNCISPMLKLLDDHFKIVDCNFTTIHATTGTQYTVDILDKTARTNRSIFNNIIPHTTGASNAITAVLPHLKGKIHGTSIRVPVLNCSLLDVNVELENKETVMEDIIKAVKENPLFDVVYQVNNKHLVSCDFITTTTPTILDACASIYMKNGKFKLMIWYDNEWSYSAQVIRTLQSMHKFNTTVQQYIINNTIKPKYYFENMDLKNKGVVGRFDFNVPMVNNKMSDDFRIWSAIPTIKGILKKQPKYLILTSHFGRPKFFDIKYSMEFMAPVLEKYLGQPVHFLKNGISPVSIQAISEIVEKYDTYIPIFLLENLRFFDEETDYENIHNKNDNSIIKLYRQLGDVFISDAFGCVHRNHMSICDMKTAGKEYGYGKLIEQEIKAIDLLLDNKDKKILGIIGGNKISDKMPLIDAIRQIPNSKLFVAGGLAKQYKESHENVIVMSDGYGNKSLDKEPMYISTTNTEEHFYDIGKNSYTELLQLILEADIIFWNGSLGVIEHEIYKLGSENVVKILEKAIHKKVIIGGGETASLFSQDFEHIYVSTGGGALLEYLYNKILYDKNIVGLDIFV